MRCKYTYPLKGKVKPSINAPIQVEDYLFELNLGPNNCISSISVSFPTVEEDLPRIVHTPNQNIKAKIYMTSPRFEELRRIMRCIEGMWAFWGIEQLEIELPEQEWIPESEAEKEKIKILSFCVTKVRREDFRPTSYDLIARPIISAVLHPTPSAVLAFFRRGLVDLGKEEFIEAIYDFFFVIESLFAQGKSRRAAVREAFLGSEVLCKYIKKAQTDSGLTGSLKNGEREEYVNRFARAKVEDIVDLILDTRGFLHHHSEKRPNIWDPEEAQRFKLEAILLQSICYCIAFDIYYQHISDGSVVERYREIADQHNSRE